MFYYTGFDRLNGTYIGGVSTHYDVNPEGQRLRKYTGSDSTWFAPDPSGALMAEDDNGTWYDYVWLNGRLIGLTVAGSVYSLHDDQTGRPQVMTTPNTPSIAWAAQNLPFDRTVTTNSYGNFNPGFPGQYFDSEVGDYWYNGARDYSALLGRYVESDPVGLAGGTNTYAYVGNNPIGRIDPLGLCDQQKCDAAKAALAALGKAISSAGDSLAWTGIGIISLSGLGAILAPEGAPLEIEGGIDGAGLIATGRNLSMIGSALTGYANGGAWGGLRALGANYLIGKVSQYSMGQAFEGGSSSQREVAEGLLDQVSGAVLQQEAACDGN